MAAWALARGAGPMGSVRLDQQALEVFALGKGQVHRVIRRALQALEDARRAPGIGVELFQKIVAGASSRKPWRLMSL